MPSGRSAVLHREIELTFGALAGLDAILGSAKIIDGSEEQGFRISKLKHAASLRGKTAAEGPILWGFSVDLSAAEIEKALEATPSGIKDVAAMEQTNRKVFPIGIIGSNETADGAPRERQVMKEISDWPFREIAEGSTLDVWGYNMKTNLTDGAILSISTVLTGEWLRD